MTRTRGNRSGAYTRCWAHSTRVLLLPCGTAVLLDWDDFLLARTTASALIQCPGPMVIAKRPLKHLVATGVPGLEYGCTHVSRSSIHLHSRTRMRQSKRSLLHPLAKNCCNEDERSKFTRSTDPLLRPLPSSIMNAPEPCAWSMVCAPRR
ncbi:hypothetical protein L226DRAFT_116857 [Lentinus tigrinus ALCF2SS1-7]|uniref:Uncharacterized protein n=1 Tax=Lentinus tigrinus ALCF2SS1-6 TaxID=1328759 RepID=A0A5C2SS77_9APHY|nr:hypothetical protein L227DRAFT_2053 [Lentinus tigrinus ALCF2SS1-6]RPD80676.1 hypothetical protein L226DRAFT_116857 [Lentinus tigrinus ALCF2SS1-7]